MFALLESIRNLLQNPYDITHLTLGMLLHYSGKLKSQILVDIQQTWMKMQTNCILNLPLLIPLCV